MAPKVLEMKDFIQVICYRNKYLMRTFVNIQEIAHPQIELFQRDMVLD